MVQAEDHWLITRDEIPQRKKPDFSGFL